MKFKLFALFCSAAIASQLLTGCVDTVDGRSEAGVPFVKDSVEGRYERSVKQVLDAARAVIKFNGTLTGDNTVINSLNGKVDRAEIFIRVDELDANKPVTRVIVQVRGRTGGTNLDLAHDLEKQIALKLVSS